MATGTNYICSDACRNQRYVDKDHARRPTKCYGCGEPKPRIRGRRLCDSCRDSRRPIWERESALRKKARAAERAGIKTKRPPASETPLGQRWCSQCQQFLPVDDFPKTKRIGYICLDCQSFYHFERRLRVVFKMTMTEYDDLFEKQGGRCAICLKEPRTRRLSVDHDHKTGQVRGLLCTRCNHKVLGSADERSTILLRAASYLENPPAVTGEPIETLGNYQEAWFEAVTESARLKANGRPWAVFLYEEDKEVGDMTVIVPYEWFMSVIPPNISFVEKVLA